MGGPLGIRSALAAGTTGSSGLSNEISSMQREAVHVVVGTPGKVNEVMSARSGLGGGDCRLLIVSNQSTRDIRASADIGSLMRLISLS